MSGVPMSAGDRRARLEAALVLAARAALGGLFLFAALPKLVDPSSLATDIDNYRMVPDLFVGPLALALPVLETCIALALLTGVHVRGAATLACVLLVAFIIGMAQAIARGIDLDCGCFGAALEARVSGWTIARNVALLVLAAIPLVLPDVAWPWPRASAVASR